MQRYIFVVYFLIKSVVYVSFALGDSPIELIMRGEEFKIILKKKGVVIATVAKQLGVTEQALHNTLRRSKDIRTGFIEQIATATGINFWDIFAGGDGDRKTESFESMFDKCLDLSRTVGKLEQENKELKKELSRRDAQKDVR